MATIGIKSTILDTQFGTEKDKSGLSLLFACGAVAVVDGLALNTLYRFTSVEDAIALGINEDYDTTNNVAIYQHVTEFYAQATTGADLYLYAIADATFTTFVASVEFINVFKSCILEPTTNEINWNLRPRLVGFAHPTNVEEGTASNFFPDAVNTLVNALPLRLLALRQDEGFRCVCVVDGCAIKVGTTGTNITSLTASYMGFANEYFTGIDITGSKPNTVASVGRTLGVMASRNFAQSIGEVRLGPVAQYDYFTDKTPVYSLMQGQFETLGGKQYIFTRVQKMQNGMYYNDGSTINNPNNALSSLDFGRVANQVCDLTETYFGRQLNSNVPIEPSTGKIDSAWKLSLIEDFRNQYLDAFIAQGNASAIDITIEEHEGDYQGTRAIDVKVSIVAAPPLRYVYNEIAFTTTI